MATAVNTFSYSIMSDVPGCPLPRIDQAVVDALRQLCTDTYLLEKTLAVNLTEATISEALFPAVFPIVFGATPGTASPLVKMIYLSLISNLSELDPIVPTWFRINNQVKELAPFEIDDNFDVSAINTESFLRGRKFYYFPSAYVLKLFPISEEEENHEVLMTLAMMPSLGVSAVDDRFSRDYKLAVESYALYLLQKMPGRPWTNLDAAALNLATYKDEVGNVRIDRTVSGLSGWTKTAQGSYF